MKKKINIILILVLVININANAQDFSRLWRSHFSYRNIVDISKSDTKVFAASENAVFSYDLSTTEINTITSVEGLPAELISTIEYFPNYQMLLVGYESGLMAIYDEFEDEIIVIVDIIDKQTIPPNIKRINDFYENNGLVYISTDFGISVYDLDRLEFGDSYFIGNVGAQIKVNKTAVFNNQIYAACDNGNGIRKADINNPNLIDFMQWTTIANGNFFSIENTQSKLFAVETNSNLSEIVNDNLQFQLNLDNNLRSSEVDGNLIIITNRDITRVYNESLILQNQFTPTTDFDTNFSCSITFDSNIFIGTETLGILNTLVATPDEYTSIFTDGPLSNNAFKIEVSSRQVWLSYGSYDLFYDPGVRDEQGLSKFFEDEWVNIPYDSLLTASDLNYIKVNPFNPSQVFVSSYQNGLLEVENDSPLILLDQNNSGLESLVVPGAPNFISIRISGSTFDRSGNFWVMNSRIDRALKKYDPVNNSWQSFSFGNLISDPLNAEFGFSDIEVDIRGTKWIGGYNFGVIGYNENSGTSSVIKNISSEEQNMPSTAVRSLALDQSNQLWIGTDFGLRVLFNTAGFFQEDNPVVNEIVILDDGIPSELLDNQYITDIKVDASNNKWVGTLDSGVFYFSPNGQTTIFQFNKDNSPLPSNTINDIGIDESTGRVYFATNNGLVSFLAGGSEISETLEDVYAYPNPVRPEYQILGSSDLKDITKGVKIVGLTDDVNIKILDIEGNLVAEAQSGINLRNSNANFNMAIDGGTAIWNGKNLANNIVHSGVYLIMITDLDTFETKTVKLLIIR